MSEKKKKKTRGVSGGFDCFYAFIYVVHVCQACVEVRGQPV